MGHLQNIHIALDDCIGGAIGVFIPRVRRADLDVGSLDQSLNLLDLGEKLFASKIAAVEGLGANCNGVDLLWELGGIRGDGVLVGTEGGVYIWPGESISTRRTIFFIGPYQMPRMT